MIRVWQISLDSLHDEINKLGWDAASKTYPLVKAYLDCSVFGSEKWSAEYFKHFLPTAKLDVVNLDHAFEVGNIGPQESIEGFLDHSVSVGDILELEDGSLHMVDSIGFTRVFA